MLLLLSSNQVTICLQTTRRAHFFLLYISIFWRQYSVNMYEYVWLYILAGIIICLIIFIIILVYVFKTANQQGVVVYSRSDPVHSQVYPAGGGPAGPFWATKNIGQLRQDQVPLFSAFSDTQGPPGQQFQQPPPPPPPPTPQIQTFELPKPPVPKQPVGQPFQLPKKYDDDRPAQKQLPPDAESDATPLFSEYKSVARKPSPALPKASPTSTPPTNQQVKRPPTPVKKAAPAKNVYIKMAPPKSPTTTKKPILDKAAKSAKSSKSTKTAKSAKSAKSGKSSKSYKQK